MRARLPWVLFAVSLALNLAFVAGAAWLHFHPPAPPDFGQRAERAGRDLDLDGRQREAFEHFVRTQRESTQAMREKNRPIFREIRREFVAPTPDDALVDRKLAEVDANRRAAREQNSRAMRDFLRTLNPEQRERFFALIEPGPRGGGGGRRP